VNEYMSIAGAIEDAVIIQIYERIERMIRFDGQSPASSLIKAVAAHFRIEDKRPEVTPGYVSALLWEEINSGKIDIDKYGVVSVASAA
jgi:hypothetical protein